jgi:hypothetical protein
MAGKAEKCIHNCGRLAVTKGGKPTESGECPICRSGFHYWKNKTATKRLKRRNQLDVLSSRLDTHFDTRGRRNEEPLVQPEPREATGNVIVFRKRRKA